MVCRPIYRMFITVLLCSLCDILYAQTSQTYLGMSLEQILLDIYTARTEDGIPTEDYESFAEDLLAIVQDPINLNTATTTDLERLQFLSDNQIDNILLYRYEQGMFHNLQELQLVPGLATYEIRNLLPFVYVGVVPTDSYPSPSSPSAQQSSSAPSWRQLWHDAKHDILMRADARNVEQWQQTNQQYIGDPMYGSLRYRLQSHGQLAIGLTAEKDVGEPFATKQHVGFDSYGAYFQLSQWKCVRRLIVGDYRAAFGQGLVINQTQLFSNSSTPTAIRQSTDALKAYGGTDEYNFLRGAGATLQFGHWNITAFYSAKQIDVTLSGGHFRSISTTGYHRTESEWQRRHSTWQQVVGANVTYRRQYLQVGLTAVQNTLKDSLLPSNNYYWRGKYQTTAGINYTYRRHHWTFFGETAIATNSRMGVGTINSVAYSPLSSLSFTLSHRYYSAYFDNAFAGALSYSSRLASQQAVYFAADITALRRWHFTLNLDAWRPRQDATLQAAFEPSERYNMNWRVRYRHTEEDNVHRWAARYQFNYLLDNISLRTQAEANYQLGSTAGFYVAQRIEWRLVGTGLAGTRPSSVAADSIRPTGDSPSNLEGVRGSENVAPADALRVRRSSSPADVGTGLVPIRNTPVHHQLRLQASVAFFRAPNYANRFYVYENDVLYAFGMQQLQGTGLRTYLNLHYSPIRQLHFYLKASNTLYLSPTISTRTDIHLLLRIALGA